MNTLKDRLASRLAASQISPQALPVSQQASHGNE